jgi:hypothetical protein
MFKLIFPGHFLEFVNAFFVRAPFDIFMAFESEPYSLSCPRDVCKVDALAVTENVRGPARKKIGVHATEVRYPVHVCNLYVTRFVCRRNFPQKQRWIENNTQERIQFFLV